MHPTPFEVLLALMAGVAALVIGLMCAVNPSGATVELLAGGITAAGVGVILLASLRSIRR